MIRLILAVFFVASSMFSQVVSAEPYIKDVERCVKNGVAYFKSIGSYPKLKTYPTAGHKAEDVALARCKRTITAFPETKKRFGIKPKVYYQH